MATMLGGRVSRDCEAAAAANGRGEYAIHMSRTSSVYPTCRMTRVSGHSEDAASAVQRSLWPRLSILTHHSLVDSRLPHKLCT